VKALTCTNHCSQCGQHFHSLKAFDIHHAHDETGWPVCLDPLDLRDRDGRDRLVALGVGERRMYPDDVRTGVTVWTTTDYERAQALGHAPESFDQTPGGPPTPKPDPTPQLDPLELFT
jgi:hypothetical protein